MRSARARTLRRALRRVRAVGLLAGAVLVVSGLGAGAQDGVLPVLTVMVDNARVMRLPERSQTIIVGNPLIADVTLQKNGVVVLTGKSYGSTNLIALDAQGALIAETTIRVEASQTSVVTVQRGLDRQSFSCTPNCQPAAQLGDASDYFGTVSGQADARRKLATGAVEGR